MDEVTTEELAGRLGEAGVTIIDVRTPAEYEGVHGAPCDPRQGHVPGAVNLDLHELAAMTTGELHAVLGPPAGEVIAYCHSGNRSAVACTLLREAGYHARNYEGSWHAWARDPALPVEPST